MQNTIDSMTWEKWKSLPRHIQETMKDNSSLSPQLRGLEGKRVEVTDIFGESRRFWVGKSTGWKPCHLEIKTIRSLGGGCADKLYKSVRVVRG